MSAVTTSTITQGNVELPNIASLHLKNAKGEAFLDDITIKLGQKINYDDYVNSARFKDLEYKKFAPTWNQNEKYEIGGEFEHIDRGHFADATFPNLFPRDAITSELKESIKLTKLTPKLGSEVRGVQISELSNAGLDEMSLYVAQRGVVVFRDQNLKDGPIERIEEIGHYYGRPHIHGTEPTAIGHPEVFLVYREQGDGYFKDATQKRTQHTTWHTDVSYEKQPPGTTFLAILQQPSEGGDTIFADTQQAYERLSPEFRKRLLGLKAIHSGVDQVTRALSFGGVSRREPSVSEHPIVRTHPVTKAKSLYVNPGFTRSIVGYKKEESDMLLNFLYDQITKAGDIQVRANWEKGTVVVWDNRRVVHTAVLDWEEDTTRHAFRMTPQAERPQESFD